jgi:hypothetical protein
MTGALVIYSATFMRYALAVSPKNYLLFACHAINFSAQCTQGYRYLNYWKYVAIDLLSSVLSHHHLATFCRLSDVLLTAIVAGEAAKLLLLRRLRRRVRRLPRQQNRMMSGKGWLLVIWHPLLPINLS